MEATCQASNRSEENLIDLSLLDNFLAGLDSSLKKNRSNDNSIGKCHNLIALIEKRMTSVQGRRNLRQLLADAQPRQSKWVLSILMMNFKIEL